MIALKHLRIDRDRHGNVRIYLRIPGRQQVRLCTADRAKGQDAGASRRVSLQSRAGIGSVKIKDLGWQGRQGSNLRQPVLETYFIQCHRMPREDNCCQTP